MCRIGLIVFFFFISLYVKGQTPTKDDYLKKAGTNLKIGLIAGFASAGTALVISHPDIKLDNDGRIIAYTFGIASALVSLGTTFSGYHYIYKAGSTGLTVAPSGFVYKF